MPETYNVYATSGGLFTIIQDDDIYNYFHTESTGNIINAQGERTALGSRIWGTGYLDGVYCSVYYNGLGGGTGNISQPAYDKMMTFFPLAVLHSIDIDYTTQRLATYECTSNPDATFTIGWRLAAGDPLKYGNIVMNATGGKLYAGGTQMGAGQNFFGYFNADTSNASFSNSVRVYVYVFNSTMTAGMMLTFNFRDGAIGYYYQCDWSRTNLTMSNNYYFLTWLSLLDPVPPTPPTPDVPDPYNPDGEHTSTEAGGDGTDPLDDEVGLEPVSFPGGINTGFCRIYCPSASELTALSDYLWSPLFDLNTVKKLFANPMDSVLGLSVVPLTLTGIQDTVYIAGVSTGVAMPKLSSQYLRVELGSLHVTEKWGAYLDYEPYTKYSIYLPFIGYRSVSADDVMGRWLNLVYDIDLLSGACVAKLVCDNVLLYQWAGSCAMQIPINSSNWDSVITGAMRIIGGAVTAVASGGAAAPLVAGSLSSAAVQSTQMKPSVEKAGSVSGAASFLAGRRAYMIRTFPKLVNPGNQPHYIGYPAFITKELGSIVGYNVVEDVHLEGIPATDTEIAEIDSLLHSGVIL